MEYVVKNKRLRNYLYTLGFDYRVVPDKTGIQDVVFLFPNTDELQKAINFYGSFKHKNVIYK